jgi:glyoxylate/hydroxypyruvate reductase A
VVALIITPRVEQARVWRQLLSERLPQMRFRCYPQLGDPAEIDIALSWKAPKGLLGSLPRLKLVYSLGMGLDHLLDDPSLDRRVPIVRLVDPNMVEQMSEYALYSTLYFHRRMDVYERFQREQRWEELPLPHTPMRRVGIMGLGEIGADCARKVAALGFPVRGWSRTRKQIAGVRCYCGDGELDAFLAECDILISVLPLTPATAGIVNSVTLEKLPRGAYFVNIARGGLVVEADLLDALDSGLVDGVMLDVVAEEPLAPDHPLWTHPKVRITPHIAGLTNPYTAVEPVYANLKRFLAGEALQHLVDRGRAY